MQSLSSRECQSARAQFKRNRTRILSSLQCTRTKMRSANFRPQLHHDSTGEWTNPPSITRPNQFVLDDRVSLSPQDFARRYEPLEELHVGIHCHSFNEVFFQDSYHNKTNKKYPPNQKFVDEGTGKEQVHLLHHQAMLLYDNTLHQKNPFYDRQSFCNYPPDNSALFANPRVIHPTFPPNLSPLHVQIFPNRSTQTYDKHVHDYPIGCETDLTLVFYHEHDTL